MITKPFSVNSAKYIHLTELLPTWLFGDLQIITGLHMIVHVHVLHLHFKYILHLNMIPNI